LLRHSRRKRLNAALLAENSLTCTFFVSGNSCFEKGTLTFLSQKLYFFSLLALLFWFVCLIFVVSMCRLFKFDLWFGVGFGLGFELRL
jgi:hypothetical protein